MLLAMDLLRGPAPRVLVAPSIERTVETITRQKRIESGPPKASDKMAWKRDGLNPVVEVFRSPIDQQIWLTRQERDEVIAELVLKAIPFTTKKGHTAFLNPNPNPARGEESVGYLQTVKGGRRTAVEYDGRRWIPLLQIGGWHDDC